MPLTGTASTWADSIIAGIDQAGMNNSEKDILKAAWQNICQKHIDHITGNASLGVFTTGVTGTGSPGGPLPITLQPGIGTPPTGGIT